MQLVFYIVETDLSMKLGFSLAEILTGLITLVKMKPYQLEVRYEYENHERSCHTSRVRYS